MSGNMAFDQIDTLIHWLGGGLALATLGMVFYGIWRGTRRQAGRTSGQMGRSLRSIWFYLFSTIIFLGIAFLGWRPLPVILQPRFHLLSLACGALFYFPGMLLTLWGRLALGRNYFVSTGFGAQLFEGHRLVTRGPYAFVRHPMYAGLFLAALGSLLIYATWTSLVFVCLAPLLIFRVRREEAALAAEFGEQWQAYCRQVPAFIPPLKR
jgi:protein-S-isoprenylcysteine O-methyltransferase Ste14